MSIHSLKRGHRKLVAQLKGQGLRYSYIMRNGQLTKDPCLAAHFPSLNALEHHIERYGLTLDHVHIRVLTYRIEDFHGQRTVPHAGDPLFRHVKEGKPRA